eukprot:542884_1
MGAALITVQHCHYVHNHRKLSFCSQIAMVFSIILINYGAVINGLQLAVTMLDSLGINYMRRRYSRDVTATNFDDLKKQKKRRGSGDGYSTGNLIFYRSVLKLFTLSTRQEENHKSTRVYGLNIIAVGLPLVVFVMTGIFGTIYSLNLLKGVYCDDILLSSIHSRIVVLSIATLSYVTFLSTLFLRRKLGFFFG